VAQLERSRACLPKILIFVKKDRAKEYHNQITGQQEILGKNNGVLFLAQSFPLHRVE
jgi:hypothetical protein